MKAPDYIGTGRRWYDLPYRILSWLGMGWRGKALPQWAVERLHFGLNYLMRYYEHDRNKARSLEDSLHNLRVPNEEHVNLAGVWVVELFPPTEIPALERAMAKNKWDRRRTFSREERNQTMLEQSRAGQGWSWWRLVDLVRPNSRWLVPDGVRTELPDEFEVVGLRVIQVGTGLTAVIAEFRLCEAAATSLDVHWHKEHEPQIIRGNGRPRALDRMWAGLRETQLARKQVHDSARHFLASKLPGFFAANGKPTPVLDLLLFDSHDPTARQDYDPNWMDALRALGLPRRDLYHATSPDLPGLLLSQNERLHSYEFLGDSPIWTLWGKRDAVVEALGENGLDGYGSDVNRAIAARLVDNMYNLFVMLAVTEFLAVSEAQHAEIRDKASQRHGKFRPKALGGLRKVILTLSLNIASVQRDVAAFWDRSWRSDGDAQFTYSLAPEVQESDRAAGRKIQEPFSYNDELKTLHQRSFSRLLEADRAYRDILSTVASLGASADSYKMGRLALWVAIASLMVALGALLVADLSGNSLLAHLWAWIKSGGIP